MSNGLFLASGVPVSGGLCGCQQPACSTCSVSSYANCCYVAAIPVAYQNVLLDVAYGGLPSNKSVQFKTRPNDRVFNLSVDALPAGWTFDALTGLLYYPLNFRPTGRFAVWTAPASPDPSGCWIWSAAELTPFCLEAVDCNASTIAASVYYCLSAQISTTLALALIDLRTMYGASVQPIFDGGLVLPSKFQLPSINVPPVWAGTVNLAAGAWSLGRCVVPTVDVFIISASYNPATNVLTFTLSNGSTVPVDMTGLLADFTLTPLALCATMNGLDTVLDASVPVTADVVYVRGDGSCGRAPLPLQNVLNLPSYADDAAAAADGLLPVNSLYRAATFPNSVRIK